MPNRRAPFEPIIARNDPLGYIFYVVPIVEQSVVYIGIYIIYIHSNIYSNIMLEVLKNLKVAVHEFHPCVVCLNVKKSVKLL